MPQSPAAVDLQLCAFAPATAVATTASTAATRDGGSVVGGGEGVQREGDARSRGEGRREGRPTCLLPIQGLWRSNQWCTRAETLSPELPEVALNDRLWRTWPMIAVCRRHLVLRQGGDQAAQENIPWRRELLIPHWTASAAATGTGGLARRPSALLLARCEEQRRTNLHEVGADRRRLARCVAAGRPRLVGRARGRRDEARRRSAA
mmetsp:Transcript_45419/g.145736  ORF Transcript_45419/g.145736 Transcript_45419/m.145736 type:complete len:206 (+) Transcript_45419:456-1073(+)